MIFMVPGRDDTLRVNGRARLVRDGHYFDAMAVRGKRPLLAMEVTVEQVYFHCAKALMRADLWEAGPPADLPSRARIAHALERGDERLADVEEYYGPSYASTLY